MNLRRLVVVVSCLHPIAVLRCRRVWPEHTRTPPGACNPRLFYSSPMLRKLLLGLLVVVGGLGIGTYARYRIWLGNTIERLESESSVVGTARGDIEYRAWGDDGPTILFLHGYGATHRVTRRSRLATVAVGYADGYLRSLSNRGSGFIGDVRVPVVGRISMDLTTFDVTDVPAGDARPGAYIDLIGPHHGVDELAAEAGTIGYEILTGLGPRFHRRYVGGED